ncbi:uncharacterized protein [Lepeophtheirus salmonis]|nr:F-box/LRR-repeat protein 7-like [Lepeophtheirus salmonis]
MERNSKDSRLSPRCFGAGPSSIVQHTIISNNSTNPSSLNSSFSYSNHSRQSSYDYYHSRESSIDSSGALPKRYPSSKLSFSSSVDMGYHTLSLNDENSSLLSPFPPSGPRPRPPPPPPKRSFFDELDDELLIKILSYLTTQELCSISRINRRFYFLVWEPALWREISFTEGNVNVDAALISLLRQQLDAYVRTASIVGCHRLSDTGVRTLASRCPELRKVEFKNCKNITNESIQDLMTRCASIDHLDLSGSSLISTVNIKSLGPPRSTAALIGVPSSQTLYLRYLDLSDCTRLTDTGLDNVVRNAPHLQFLYLRRCLNLTDVGIKYIATFCLGLKELSLCDVSAITDFGLYELSKLGPSLRYLSIAKCERITDSGVSQITRLCYKLRYLNIRGCESVSDGALVVLGDSIGTRLRSLDLGKCDITDEGLRNLAEKSCKLRKLSLKSCEMISDVGIRELAFKCRDLRHLNIQDCGGISIEGYHAIKKCCKKCVIEHTNPNFF